MMRGGGWNAENTQVSDGRRMLLRKCRKCANSVRAPRTSLCADCNQLAYDRRRKVVAEKSRAACCAKEKQTGAANDLSRGLAGLQSYWLADIGGIA